MCKTKKTIFNSVGKILDDETGEIIEPKSEDYRITLEELF